MECFKKALKSTEAIFNAHPNEKNFTLYVAILNKFLYYFGKDEFQAVTFDFGDNSVNNIFRLDLMMFKNAWKLLRANWRS